MGPGYKTHGLRKATSPFLFPYDMQDAKLLLNRFEYDGQFDSLSADICKRNLRSLYDLQPCPAVIDVCEKSDISYLEFFAMLKNALLPMFNSKNLMHRSDRQLVMDSFMSILAQTFTLTHYDLGFMPGATHRAFHLMSPDGLTLRSHFVKANSVVWKTDDGQVRHNRNITFGAFHPNTVGECNSPEELMEAWAKKYHDDYSTFVSHDDTGKLYFLGHVSREDFLAHGRILFSNGYYRMLYAVAEIRKGVLPVELRPSSVGLELSYN